MDINDKYDVVKRLRRYYLLQKNLCVNFQCDRIYRTIGVRKLVIYGSIVSDCVQIAHIHFESLPTLGQTLDVLFSNGDAFKLEAGNWERQQSVEKTLGSIVATSGGAGLALLALRLERDDFFLDQHFSFIRSLENVDVYEVRNHESLTRLFVAKDRAELLRTSERFYIPGGKVVQITRYLTTKATTKNPRVK